MPDLKRFPLRDGSGLSTPLRQSVGTLRGRNVHDARRHGVVLPAVLSVLGCAGLGCGGSVTGNAGLDASLTTPDASVADDDANPVMPFPAPDGASQASCPPGSPLSCYVDMNCSSPTTITGTVYDPAGRNPIDNAVVFVPNDPAKLPAIPTGVHSCNVRNVTIGDYVTFALTDAAGHFSLKGVPTGATFRSSSRSASGGE